MAKKLDDAVTRVEKHIIRPSSRWFSMLAGFCHLAKNLYNHANYLVRTNFAKDGKWLRYAELDKVLKNDLAYPDYRSMPTAQSAQQVLRLLDKNWKSFFAAIKDWGKKKEKYLGRPKLPKYKAKDGRMILVMTNQNCKYIDGRIQFPKAFKDFAVIPRFASLPTSEGEMKKLGTKRIFNSFKQVRFVPNGTDIVMEIVYTIQPIAAKKDNGRYAGIDVGVDNLLTMAVNTGRPPMIIKGKIPKSVNQFYNKRLARLKSICQQMTGHGSSRRIRQFAAKRNRRIDDYLHKASRLVVDECVRQEINTIIIGQNKEWKQGCKLTRRINQHFVHLPFARLIQMIEYKAKEQGIAVILTEESYTSGTSFLDGELPVKENYIKSRRIHRGLFRADDGRLINADVNGAFQIMRKVFPNVSADGIGGVVLRPIVVVAA